jgi:nucleoside-triphosphatase
MLPACIVRTTGSVNAPGRASRGREVAHGRAAAPVEAAQAELVGELQRPLELRAVQVAVDLGIPVSGFVTEELRESGRRLGFSVERLGGERGVLAHVKIPGPPRVGRYGVDLTALERLAIPALEQAGEDDVAIIDELGKMELASRAFREAVSALLDRPVLVVATVQSASHPFTDAFKRRRDIETLRVTTTNHDELPELLAARLRSAR